MKCPKCGYLGFETGDTCKNCGYDFSLLAPPPPQPSPDIAIRTDESETGAPEVWLDRLDRSVGEVSRPSKKEEHLLSVPEPSVWETPPDPLPLFNPDHPDDAPLVALPGTPRAPLSVRRTAEASRLRSFPRTTNTPTPTLDFYEEARADDRDEADAEPFVPTELDPRRVPVVGEGMQEVGGRRVVAALIDTVILFAIDLAVVYFTARLAELGQDELEMLPLVPMAIFLGLLKVAYFTAFTAIGGQTIGKMAVGIEVVAETGDVNMGVAIRRTLAGLLSVLSLGLGFLPAFFGADRRTLHDRLAGTRVIGLRSA